MAISGGATTGRMDMLNGPLLSKILMFALPLAASSVLQQLFNSVDIAVVGRFSGPEALAAVGSVSSIVNLIISLFVGLSVGANVLVARYVGTRNRVGIKRAVSTIFSVSVLSGFFLTAVGLLFTRPILEAIDTPDDVIDLSALYLRLYFAGMPFITVFNFCSAILRGMGDSKRPLYCLIISGFVNAVVNVILVAGFGLGVLGVGLGTIVSNLLNVCMVIYILVHEKNPFCLKLKRLGIFREELVFMIRIGVPAGIQGMVFALANVCIQSSINSFGSAAVAGSAAALTYEHICYYLINAFTGASVTFVGQNFAAGKKDRCRKIFIHAMWLGLLSCGLANLFFTWQKTFFIGLFSDDPNVLEFAYVRMNWVLLLQFIACSYEISSGCLRGLGYSSLPALLTVFGTCVLRLCWVTFVVPAHHEFHILMLVYPVSWVVTGMMVLGAFFWVANKKGIF